jgi:hypothetical protein
MPRTKFLCQYGDLELRVEQMGPHIWHGAVDHPICVPKQDDPSTLVHFWGRFTCRTEECVKRCAMITGEKLVGPVPKSSEEEWRDCSDEDESWDRILKKRNFPGYLQGPGDERFPFYEHTTQF